MYSLILTPNEAKAVLEAVEYRLIASRWSDLDDTDDELDDLLEAVKTKLVGHLGKARWRPY